MSDHNIEKSFLYLILLSILLHMGAFGLFSLLPREPLKPEETTMVDLQDLPEPPPPVKREPKPKPKPKPEPIPETKPLPKPVPVPLPRAQMLPPDLARAAARKEAAPKAENKTERIAESKRAPNVQGKTETKPQAVRSPGKTDSVFSTPEKGGKETRRGEGLLKPQKGEKVELAKLFPDAKKLESLQESYRKKYRDIEEGDTRMIDTQDPLVAVYTNRLLVAANNSLALESTKRVITDTGVVGALMVTVNRDGTIEDVKMIESTKSAALDDIAISSVYKAGYIGPVPKKWPHEKLRVVWIFVPGQPGMPHRR